MRDTGTQLPGGRKRLVTNSLEDYLKALYDLSQMAPLARTKDIADTMNVSVPSVNAAMKRLKGFGFVDYEKYGLIFLTEEGAKRAVTLMRIQQLLETFFIDLLGMPKSISAKLSCKIEHYFDDEISSRSALFVDLLKKVKNEEEGALSGLVQFLQDRTKTKEV